MLLRAPVTGVRVLFRRKLEENEVPILDRTAGMFAFSRLPGTLHTPPTAGTGSTATPATGESIFNPRPLKAMTSDGVEALLTSSSEGDVIKLPEDIDSFDDIVSSFEAIVQRKKVEAQIRKEKAKDQGDKRARSSDDDVLVSDVPFGPPVTPAVDPIVPPVNVVEKEAGKEAEQEVPLHRKKKSVDYVLVSDVNLSRSPPRKKKKLSERLFSSLGK